MRTRAATEEAHTVESMRKKLIALIGICAVVLASPAAATAGEKRGSLGTALDRVTAAGMPGAFAAARSPSGRESAASGVADLSTGRPVKPGFRHRAGSITKTLVATALLQLVGEGRVQLDAPVSTYVPQYDTTGVTVRMLLNHTSGIADFDHVIWQVPDDLLRHRHTTFTPDQLVRFGLDQPRGPHVFSYANTNYALIGMIIERVTGRNAIAEVHRRIIAPLRLHNTYLAGTTERIFGPHSKGYIPWFDGIFMDFSVYNMSFGWMLGDLVSTPEDLNTFFRALLTGKLLRPSELDQMKTTVPLDPTFPEGGGYGLGLLSIPTPCGYVWGHDGLVFGYSMISLATVDASRQVSIAQNMSHYADPSLPDPISMAVGQLLVETLCPGPSLRQAYAWRSPVHANKTW